MLEAKDVLRIFIEDEYKTLCNPETCETCKIKERFLNVLNEKVKSKFQDKKEYPDVMREEIFPLPKKIHDKIFEIKQYGNEFCQFLDDLSDSQEIEIAKMKLEEVVMWAVKGVSNDDS
jgi:hypothetical protein